MLTFPILRTGAIAQYPLSTSEGFANDVLTFMAGDEQRYRTAPGALKTWRIQLDLLDEGELEQIQALFQMVAGSSGIFSFTDPASGKVYAKCHFVDDKFQQVFSGELRSRVALSIMEGRG